MDELRQNPRNFDKTFKQFLDLKDKGDDTRDIQLNIDGSLETDQKRVTEHLVEYFSTMASGNGGDNVESLVESDFMEHSSFKSTSTMMAASNNSFCFRPVSHQEVKDTLDKMESRKSTGHDGLKPRILKLAAEELAPSLTMIFNSSIEKGEWITPWKQEEWIPVFKKDDRREVINYRPVTVLPGCRQDKLLSKITAHIYPKPSHCLKLPSYGL